MPTLRKRKGSRLFKAMGAGDPGTGKTGSLIDVIARREELGIERIVLADFDDGADILDNFVQQKDQDVVHVETFRDLLRASPEGSEVDTSQLDCAWSTATRTLNKWPDLGAVSEFGRETLLVMDSLTGMGDAALNYAATFGESGDNWRATGAGMRLQDKLVQRFIALKCHVVIFSHIRYMGGGGTKVMTDEKGSNYQVEVDSSTDGQGYPSALGKILPKTIARHFNILIEYKVVGKHRKIRTVPEDRIGIKVPLKMPEELPQPSGLFQIMKTFLNV